MKLVNSALEQKNLKVQDLSAELKERLAVLDQLIKKYNEACDEYDEEDEKDTETEDKLNSMADHISETETELAQDIKDFSVEPTPPAEPEHKKAEGDGKEEEEKGGSLGWLIFGGIALVATLGAVNLLKKK